MKFFYNSSTLLLLAIFCSNQALKADDSTATVSKKLFSTSLEPSRIAYLRVEKILPMENMDQGSHEWRDGVKKVTEHLSNESAKIQSDYQRAQKLYTELEEGKKWSSAEVHQKKQRELSDLKDKIEKDRSDLQQLRTNQAQELQMKMVAKIEKTTSEYAQKQGWDAVLMAGGIYVGKRIDITDDILALLNKEYGSQKPKDAAAKPAQKPAEKK